MAILSFFSFYLGFKRKVLYISEPGIKNHTGEHVRNGLEFSKLGSLSRMSKCVPQSSRRGKGLVVGGRYTVKIIPVPHLRNEDFNQSMSI